MNIKMPHIERRARPPVLRVVCDVVSIADDRRFAVLRAGRTVEVVAVQPDSGTVQHFAGVCLADGFGGVGDVEVEICGTAVFRKEG